MATKTGDLSLVHDTNETFTEYFNGQLPGGGALSEINGAPAEYEFGPKALARVRDERLGPHGEQVLRDCYFKGDCAPLDKAFAASPAGPEDKPAFIDHLRSETSLEKYKALTDQAAKDLATKGYSFSGK